MKSWRHASRSVAFEPTTPCAQVQARCWAESRQAYYRLSHPLELCATTQALATVENQLKRVDERDKLLAQYFQASLAGVGPNAPKIDDIQDSGLALLQFHSVQSSELDSERMRLKQERRVAQDARDTARAKLNKLTSDPWSQGGRNSRDVTVLCDVPETANEATEILLELTYVVSGASWHSSYDLRVEDESDAAQNKLTVNYFGNIVQRTGEDWEDVALSLSTASPARGGKPADPPTLHVHWQPQRFRHHNQERGYAKMGAPQPMMAKSSRSRHAQMDGGAVGEDEMAYAMHMEADDMMEDDFMPNVVWCLPLDLFC